MRILSSLLYLIALLWFPGHLLGAGPPVVNVLEEFKCGREAGPLVVPLTINGKSYPFLVDTGCTNSVFDDAFSPLLGEAVGSVSANSPTGPTVVRLFAAPDAFIGRLPFKTQRHQIVLVHASPRRFSEGTGMKVYGLLGMDFLSRYALRVDMDRGCVSFHRSGLHWDGERVRLRTNAQRIPCVQARFQQAELASWFTVDTGWVGHGCGNLEIRTYRALEKQGQLRQVAHDTRSMGPGGVKYSPIGRLELLTIGSFQHKGLCFRKGGVSGPGAVLGLSFWARYIVTFDFPSERAFMFKGKRHGLPDLVDGSGLDLLYRTGRLMVEAVVKGSPAAREDICRGDEILSIDGRKAAQATLFVMRKLLQGQGRKVQLVVRRGDKQREVQVTLAAYKSPDSP
jgi:hypothetical protein